MILLIATLFPLIISAKGVSVVFRPHPTGWTCNDPPMFSTRLVYSFDNRSTFSSVVSRIFKDCQNRCLRYAWCRSYSLQDLPLSLPDPKITPITEYYEYEDGSVPPPQTTAGCNLYSQPHCSVAKWPAADSSVMIFRISAIENYELVDKKCLQNFGSYEAGPPVACGRACDSSPQCVGFNYKVADNLCFMISNNNEDQSTCSRQRPDLYMVFFAKKVPLIQSKLNDPLPQPYPGFFGYNGNCRGGVSANLEGLGIGTDGLPLAVAVHSCPGCKTTVQVCLDTCRNLVWCRGVSVYGGPLNDYSKPICFLKSAKCDPSKADPNAVYRFYEKLNS